MNDWKQFLYDTAIDYYLKESMSNFMLARQFLIDKIDNVLSPLKQIDEDLYHIDSKSVRVGHVEIKILTEFLLPGENINAIRVVKRNIKTDEIELSVKIHLNDIGGNIQYGDGLLEKVTEDNIDLLLKNLLMDCFQ